MLSLRTGSIVVLASLFAVAACGSSAKKVDPAADLATAKRAVLTQADLPGYTSAPHTTDDDLPAANKKSFAACMGTSITIFDDSPGAQKANSPDFSKAEAQVSNTVSLVPKQSDVDDSWKQLTSTKTAPCLQKLFDALFRSGAADAPNVVFGPTKVTRFEPGVGSRSVGYAVAFSATSAGRKVSFFADVVFVGRDRAEMDMEFFNQDAAVDRALETSLVQKSYDRIGGDAK
jgi:hypothetical protein